jgi:hypothetical protein
LAALAVVVSALALLAACLRLVALRALALLGPELEEALGAEPEETEAGPSEVLSAIQFKERPLASPMRQE